MAGIVGSNVDFSPLADIGGILREGQDRRLREATLADLQSTDPNSLEKKASDLIRQGFLAEGLSLQKAALDRRALTQKGLADQLQLEWVRNVAPGLRSGAAAPSGDNQGNVQFNPISAPPVPSTALPSQSPPAAFPAPPGPQGSLPQSPTEAILAAAEGGGPQAPPPGQQLAGPLPTPDTAPGLSPATVQGAQLRPAPAMPSAAPPAVAPPNQLTPTQAEGRGTIVKVGDTLLTMPPGSQRLPAFQKFMADYRNALAQQKLSPEMESYRIDQIQHYQATGEDLSHSEWKRDVQSNPVKYKDAVEQYANVRDTGGKAQGMINTIAQMDRISKDPNFVSGLLSGQYGDWINKASSLAQIAGVTSFTPQSVIDIVKSAAAPHLKAAALREQFESLSNAAVLANAGSLSKGFSEGDRVFTSKMFASAANTPGGIAAINEQLKAIAEHNVALSKVATEYMSDTEKGSKSTPWGLQKAIDKYNAEHPLFVEKDGKTLIPLAKRAAAPEQATPITITPAHEGKTGKYQDGTRFIIRGGKPEPYTP